MQKATFVAFALCACLFTAQAVDIKVRYGPLSQAGSVTVGKDRLKYIHALWISFPFTLLYERDCEPLSRCPSLSGRLVRPQWSGRRCNLFQNCCHWIVHLLPRLRESLSLMSEKPLRRRPYTLRWPELVSFQSLKISQSLRSRFTQYVSNASEKGFLFIKAQC